MMALVESEAAFEKRCDELARWLHQAFTDHGIGSFSSLAFAIGTPQQPASEQDMQRFCDRICQGPASLAEVSTIKRIHFEATTLMMVDLKRQATAGDSSEPARSLPFVEKQRRLEAQQQRITGISHKHEQKASHALIDHCFHIVETGALVYVPPSKCTSRDSEIQNDSKSKQKQVVTLEQGALKTVHGDSLQTVDVGTELRLMYAFQRRGLAFDLVGLLSWDLHSAWINKLFRAIMAEAPANFSPVSVQQILRADQEMFLLLAEEHNGPLKAAGTGQDPPLDATLQACLNDPRINVHLVPNQRVEKRAHNSGQEKTHSNTQANKKQKTQHDKAPAQLPTELSGLNVKTKDNKPLCWNFNMKRGCANPLKKGRCRFGFHTCMKCLKANHGASNCTSA